MGGCGSTLSRVASLNTPYKENSDKFDGVVWTPSSGCLYAQYLTRSSGAIRRMLRGPLKQPHEAPSLRLLTC